MLRRIGFAACLLCYFLVFAEAGFLSGMGVLVSSQGLALLDDFAFALLGTFGYLIIRQQPANVVGWLALIPAFFNSLEGFLFEYLRFSIVEGLAGFGPPLVAWLLTWIWIPIPYSVPAVLLLFPDGRLPSPRWRPFLGAFVALIVVTAILVAFASGPLDPDELPGVTNPLGTPAVAAVLDALAPVLFGFQPLLVLLGAISLVLRYRRGNPTERQQVKWIAWAGAVGVIFFAVTSQTDLSPLALTFAEIVFIVVIGSAIYVAVTRHGLYEIDRLLGRTVVYGLVIAVLAGVYFGVVAALGALVGEDNTLAVAGATLAAAAAFSPVRRRLQGWVEKRFDRSRYDAQQVVDRFGSRLQDEIKLDDLTSDLVEVIDQTLRPQRVSIWLPADGEPG